MARWEEYRRFAEECVKVASEVKDEQVRRALLHMAQVWLRLAERDQVQGSENT